MLESFAQFQKASSRQIFGIMKRARCFIAVISLLLIWIFFSWGTASASAIAARKLIPMSIEQWGQDGYFKLKWQHHADDSIVGVDLSPTFNEIWVISGPISNLSFDSNLDHGMREAEAAALPGGEALNINLGALEKYYEVSVLDRNGEHLRKLRIKDAGEVGNFRVLETGKWDKGGPQSYLAVFDHSLVSLFSSEGNKVWDFPAAERPNSFAAVPAQWGGPLIVAAYNYGPVGLRAVGVDGKLAWALAEPDQLNRVSVARLKKKTVLVADNGVGKIYLIDLKGKIIERIECKGNLDRVLFDESQARMYGLDSRADSWKEKLFVYKAEPGGPSNGSQWKPYSSVDLGRVTFTAFALGDFNGSGERNVVVGTDNGWVLLLDPVGNVISEARFRGKIQFLGAINLPKSRKQALIVCVQGPSGGVFAFSRP